MIGAIEAPGQGVGSIWHGGGVPDIMCDETQRWFYYLAVRYLKAELRGHPPWPGSPHRRCRPRLPSLCQALRPDFVRRQLSMAGVLLLLDAHSHGIAVDGELLFDFCSMPMTSRSIHDRFPLVALVHRGQTRGGRHPGGWDCDESPCLFEQDNWLGYSLAKNSPAWHDFEARAAAGKWGWDDITWYAHLKPDRRSDWHHYARTWAATKGAENYYQPA